MNRGDTAGYGRTLPTHSTTIFVDTALRNQMPTTIRSTAIHRWGAIMVGLSGRDRGLRLPVLQGRRYLLGILPRELHDLVVRGERTGGIGHGGVAGQMEGLAATAAEILGPAVAAPAWLGHPVFTAEGVECGRIGPDLAQRPVPDVVEADSRQRVGDVAGQHEPVRADHQK